MSVQRSSCEGDLNRDRLYVYMKDAMATGPFHGTVHFQILAMTHDFHSFHVSAMPTSLCVCAVFFFFETMLLTFIICGRDTSFDFLGLGYRVDWPISIILTPGALKIYSEIFSFLIQVKLALISLSDAWSSLKVRTLN